MWTRRWRIIAGVLIGSVACAAGAQDVVRVDATDVQADVSRHPLGININYLTDRPSFQATGARPLVDALQEMGVRFLRYPGGEKSDAYLWSEPPYDAPHPALSRTGPRDFWSTQRKFVAADGKSLIDPMNFDEFMKICRAVQCVPDIVVNHDSYLEPPKTPGSTAPTREQLLDSAAAWVRYANVTKRYGARLWEIGNETYMDSYNAPKESASSYAEDVRLFSRRMKAEDPTILIGANGGDYNYFHTLLTRAGQDIDFLVVHAYPCCASYAGYQRTTFFDQAVKPARKAIGELPPDRRARVGIAVTEMNALDFKHTWADRNDLGHSLLLFEMIGQFLWFDPDVGLVELWNTRWIDNDDPTKPASIFDALDSLNHLNPSGRVLSIWNSMLGSKIVKAYWPGGDGMVTAYAALDSSSGTLNVFLVNRDRKPRPTRLLLEHFQSANEATAHQFSGSGPDDMQPVFRLLPSLRITPDATMLELAPVSITAISVQRTGAQGGVQ
jgi:alpha-L-arabinofuranosidase